MARASGGLFRAGLLFACALGVACVAYLRVAEADDTDRHPFVVVSAQRSVDDYDKWLRLYKRLIVDRSQH